jgi:hypothetical protein
VADEANKIDVDPMVHAIARANHNYFQRRGQTRYSWDELMPLIRHRALEAQLEIFMDGPADLLVQVINDALGHAPVLRLRVEMLIAELRGEPFKIQNNAQIADALQAIIDRPLED